MLNDFLMLKSEIEKLMAMLKKPNYNLKNIKKKIFLLIY